MGLNPMEARVLITLWWTRPLAPIPLQVLDDCAVTPNPAIICIFPPGINKVYLVYNDVCLFHGECDGICKNYLVSLQD